MQACGTALVERRRTWIKPFWKGPAEATEAIARLCKIENPSKASDQSWCRVPPEPVSRPATMLAKPAVRPPVGQ